MNFSINPISSNNILSSVIYSYKQSENIASEVSSVVYDSLVYLTESQNGINLQSLKDLKQTLENENLTGYSAYKLVNTIINRFDALSSDGKTITENDFTGAVKFSAAQDFASNSAVGKILQKSGISVSDAIKEMFGTANSQTQAFIQLVDSLSEESLSKILQSIDPAQAKDENKETVSYASNPIKLSKAPKPAFLSNFVDVRV